MKYEECEEYLSELSTKGIKPGLDAIKELLRLLGNPQDDLKIIHIAGTNGKGSTGRFIFEILRAQGYKVGIYSSPAVFEEREIIRINGRNISKEDYVNYVERIKNTDASFTRFELETAMAYLYFKEKECDFAIIECGMGGGEDATNVMLKPEVSVFTSIGLDHMGFLGETVEEIAASKAGIIRKNSRVVVNFKNEAAANVIKKRAEELECLLFMADPDEIQNLKFSRNTVSFDFFDFKNIKLSMLGEYQPENAINAIGAVMALRDADYTISDKAVYEGLHNAIIPGRFEIISKKPLIVIDGAHNEPASLRLRKSIKRYFTDRKLIFIMGVLKDKEYDKVIENTCDLAWQVITVTSPMRNRALPAIDLAKSVSRVNGNVTAADSVEEALELALMLSDEETVIVAFGSLSYLGILKKAVERRKKK